MIIFSLSDWSLCDIQLFITDRLMPACLPVCFIAYIGRVDNIYSLLPDLFIILEDYVTSRAVSFCLLFLSSSILYL